MPCVSPRACTLNASAEQGRNLLAVEHGPVDLSERGSSDRGLVEAARATSCQRSHRRCMRDASTYLMRSRLRI
eukprot:2445474-Rhodomonas_salina.3